MENLYPWHQLAWDISVAQGMEDDIEQGFMQQIATELNRDIQNGSILCWAECGDPIRGPVPLEMQRRSVPHITEKVGNDWLKKSHYLYTWTPLNSHAQGSALTPIDFTLIATREALLDAFKQWGLNADWFKDLNSHKWLLNARRVKGHGQRGNRAPALFCPLAVMQGFISSVRGTKRISPEKAWSVLEQKFPKVYANFSVHDPR